MSGDAAGDDSCTADRAGGRRGSNLASVPGRSPVRRGDINRNFMRQASGEYRATIALAVRRPSTAALTIPPAYPAPSPTGYSPRTPGDSRVSGVADDPHRRTAARLRADQHRVRQEPPVPAAVHLRQPVPRPPPRRPAAAPRAGRPAPRRAGSSFGGDRLRRPARRGSPSPAGPGSGTRRGPTRTPAARTAPEAAPRPARRSPPNASTGTVTTSPLLANGESRFDRLMPLVQKYPPPTRSG